MCAHVSFELSNIFEVTFCSLWAVMPIYGAGLDKVSSWFVLATRVNLKGKKNKNVYLNEIQHYYFMLPFAVSLNC